MQNSNSDYMYKETAGNLANSRALLRVASVNCWKCRCQHPAAECQRNNIKQAEHHRAAGIKVLATFIHKDLRWTHEGVFPNHSDIYWLHTKLDTTSIINVYKSSSSQMTIASLPVFSPPSIYAGNFNCQPHKLEVSKQQWEWKLPRPMG